MEDSLSDALAEIRLCTVVSVHIRARLDAGWLTGYCEFLEAKDAKAYGRAPSPNGGGAVANGGAPMETMERSEKNGLSSQPRSRAGLGHCFHGPDELHGHKAPKREQFLAQTQASLQHHPAVLSELCRLVEAAQIEVYKQEGEVKELLLTPTGIQVMCVFGLPPQFHSDDAMRGAVAGRVISQIIAGAKRAKLNAALTRELRAGENVLGKFRAAFVGHPTHRPKLSEAGGGGGGGGVGEGGRAAAAPTGSAPGAPGAPAVGGPPRTLLQIKSNTVAPAPVDGAADGGPCQPDRADGGGGAGGGRPAVPSALSSPELNRVPSGPELNRVPSGARLPQLSLSPRSPSLPLNRTCILPNVGASSPLAAEPAAAAMVWPGDLLVCACLETQHCSAARRTTPSPPQQAAPFASPAPPLVCAAFSFWLGAKGCAATAIRDEAESECMPRTRTVALFDTV
jgi:hypothetical protein